MPIYRFYNSKKLIQKILLLVLLILILIIFISLPISNEFKIGTGDFRPYWSASYLLRKGQDFSDLILIDQIERDLTHWEKPFTMMAWFAPTGMVVLLPFTLLSFHKAAFLWLLLNIFVVSTTALLLWVNINKNFWISLLVFFCFPMTLLSLYFGQINTFVLLGLALYLSFVKSQHQYMRGIGLALTTIKPHLVILTLPLILLECFYRKQWKILIGFLGTLLVSAIILTTFYPLWPISFWKLVSSGMSTIRETPTISGLIVFTTGKSWGKWLWIPGLLFLLITWLIKKEEWNSEIFFYLSIPLSLAISPIGWGYDQILLLIPIIFILIKNNQKNINIFKPNLMKIIIFFIYGIIFILRFLSINEVLFFWIPITICLLLVLIERLLLKK